jgi:hypothetical protein
MKVLVCVKRVIDANVTVGVRTDGSDVDLSNVKMSILSVKFPLNKRCARKKPVSLVS